PPRVSRIAGAGRSRRRGPDAVEPLNLTITPWDHGKALGVDLDAEAMGLGHRPQLIDGALLSGWPSLMSGLRRSADSHGLAESDERASCVGAGPSVPEVRDTEDYQHAAASSAGRHPARPTAAHCVASAVFRIAAKPVDSAVLGHRHDEVALIS